MNVTTQATVSGDAIEACKPNLDEPSSAAARFLFVSTLVAGLAFTGYSLIVDVSDAGESLSTFLPYLLLGGALFIALGFEFVNGFHDTANAVSTVIYTNSLSPHVAVVWSGICNFLGVLVSSGAVAFGIVSLLPVELMLQVGSAGGFAMVFALLIAAILWNLGTWWIGLPASSSHTLIGSIIGVGIANALMRGRSGTAGIDWEQAIRVGYSLLLSPMIGFVCAALVLLAMRALVRNRTLYEEPKGCAPPPWWIRGLMILSCTGVSFAHGSNDGQKGMGLIMLILVGTVPLSYSLNRAMPVDQVTEFVAVAHATGTALAKAGNGQVVEAPRRVLEDFLQTRAASSAVIPALAAVASSIGEQIEAHGALSGVPANRVPNVRNDMYLASETIRAIQKSDQFVLDASQHETLKAFRSRLDAATKFIPVWVKIAVAVALGLGTMMGWKRVVVTVGERIGRSHMTYAQGASAGVVAMSTIGVADLFGLPVSTTHVLSSGVAGSMVANRSGLRMGTVRDILLTWVLTLPAAIALSGSLYWLFSQFI